VALPEVVGKTQWALSPHIRMHLRFDLLRRRTDRGA
jgi:hypothetical protein